MNNSLAISGMGIVSPIGHDAKTTCASLRCGINRFGPLDFSYMDETDLEMVALTGSRISGITNGYSGIALLTILSTKALDSLIQEEQLDLKDNQFWEKTKISISHTAQRVPESDLSDNDIEEELISKLFKYYNKVIPYRNFSINFNGNTASFHSITEIFDSLSAGDFDRGVVVAVDSLVEGDVLEYYLTSQRVLMPDNSNGMIPGEAGAAIMLESSQSLKRQGKSPLSYITRPVISQEENSFLSSDGVIAPVLAQTFIRSAQLVEKIDSLYIDLNGELSKVKYYGAAIPSVVKALKHYPEAVIVPAESLGDIGAVTPLVSICSAIQSYRRNYAHGDKSLILAIADSGECGSLLITEKDLSNGR